MSRLGIKRFMEKSTVEEDQMERRERGRGRAEEVRKSWPNVRGLIPVIHGAFFMLQRSPPIVELKGVTLFVYYKRSFQQKK